MAMEDSSGHGLSDPKMLEKIDKLFACGVGEYINLPQIVVVGDQSSGKSSVLEGLTKIPFPRDSGLCTRFATQIVFRRASRKAVVVSIIPDPGASNDHKERTKAWKRECEVLDADIFREIMTEVHHAMGLASKQDRAFDSGSIFTSDVLSLEISGPQQEHLSVIDLPGIFKNTAGGTATKADMVLVQNMVRKYMENPRSAMLTVIPSNVDIATQEILEMAAEFDRDGRRTLGVLTKPDLVDPGAEPSVVDLIEGRTHVMRLGWHLVRNPGQSQLGDQNIDRDTLETSFFQNTAPWKSLDREKFGIEALRQRLHGVLWDLVRHEDPYVRKEINQRLTLARSRLKTLGVERETTEDQSMYLTQMAMSFQRLVSLAVDAKYGKDTFFDTDLSLRLATAIVSRNTNYGDGMNSYGEEYPFVRATTEPSDEEDMIPPALDWSQDEDEDEDEVTEYVPYEIRQHTDPSSLDDLLQPQETVCLLSGRPISRWLQEVYESSRGFELGTFDSSMLAATMKEQSTKWTLITLGYISDVIALIHRFVTSALEFVCHDERVRVELLAVLTEELLGRYETAMEQARFLLAVERSGTPITLNQYFSNNLEKCRLKRMKAKMESLSFDLKGYGRVVKLDNLAQTHPMSNTRHVVQEIHDILFAYYQVACKRLVDNVCMQVVDHVLVNGPKSPLNLFSPTFVSGLKPDQLETIAGEDQMTKRTRKQLVREIQNLTKARKILM